MSVAAPDERSDAGHLPRTRTASEIAALSLGALGVVYGDIGTSPLYALRECVHGPHAVSPTPANLYGILSLITWALVLIVAVKYLVFVVRADNRGEGGILALLALISLGTGSAKQKRALLVFLALVGTGLLVGDGVITPVISVLGAVEGLSVSTPAFAPAIVPITIAILVLLFLVQRRGTGSIGRAFGGVMLIWFATLAITGGRAIALHPEVLGALRPVWGVRFFIAHGWHALLLLGSVFLVATGSEALYADLGHFGRPAIRLGWFVLVMPSLLLNYYGQGAILLQDPAAADNPFYALAPGWLHYPMLLLATAAAVIASQALISGLFSLARQAMQLGYSPRLRVLHTSASEEGQIYVPEINYMMMVSCVLLVIGFGSSSAVAAAYGIAVTGTMIITTVLFAVAARERMGWGKPAVIAFAAAFSIIEVAFFSANVVKIPEGGWFALGIGALVVALMTTWRRGRQHIAAQLAAASLPLDTFLADLTVSQPHRSPGTAVFMTSSLDSTPPVLLHYFKHSKVLHESVVLFTVIPRAVPKVDDQRMVEVSALGHGFWRVAAQVGFMQDPNVPAILRAATARGLKVSIEDISYYLGRETLVIGGTAPIARWRKMLFGFLSRNARPATQFFHLPPNRVLELGTQIEL